MQPSSISSGFINRVLCCCCINSPVT